MKVLVTEPQSPIIGFLCDRLQLVPTKNLVCFGQWDTDRNALVAAVGFDNWSFASVEMHVASDVKRWMTKELLYKSFYYPFDCGGVNAVLGRVGGDNEEALKLNAHLGFKEAGRVPNAWKDGEDLVLMAMQRADCKWLKLGTGGFLHKRKVSASPPLALAAH